MPFGYLFTVAVLAAGTALSLTAPRRPRALARAAWLSSAVVNELSPLCLAVLVAATALAFGEGDIGSPGAYAVVALAALTLIGLALLIGRAARARAALAAALGPSVELPRRRLGRILLAPFPLRPPGVERIRDVAYGDAGRHRLDVYRRRSRTSAGPTLIHFHGGGYSGGGKSREARPLLHRLARQGWTCISANYRLRPDVTFPEHLIDVKRVIAWVREHGHRYGADPRTVVVAGSSAGGHLAAFAGLTAGEPALQPGFEAADTSVAAAICLYPYLGRYYGQGPESSPAAHVRPDAPPFLVVQGDADTFSPNFVGIVRDFVERLRGVATRPVVYAELPGGQHSFDVFGSLRFEAVVDAIEAFTAGLQPEVAHPLSSGRYGLPDDGEKRDGGGPRRAGGGGVAGGRIR
ncbi:MAG TPA: alpha/beta hydrolase [Solirubrobacter sp.]|nr:alpha/beta hydrolase [Solirubrobacter sp.]